MRPNSDLGHWEEFQDHLDAMSEVESYELLKDSGMAKVYFQEDISEIFIGRALFTRVANMGFIVGEVHGGRSEIKFINILGEHRGYLPEEAELGTA